jgi:hypothetical protein
MKKLLKTGTIAFGVLLYSGGEGMQTLPNGMEYDNVLKILKEVNDRAAEDFVKHCTQGLDPALKCYFYDEGHCGDFSALDVAANHKHVKTILAFNRPDLVTADLVVKCISTDSDGLWCAQNELDALSQLIDIVIHHDGIDALRSRGLREITDAFSLGVRSQAKNFLRTKGLL